MIPSQHFRSPFIPRTSDRQPLLMVSQPIASATTIAVGAASTYHREKSVKNPCHIARIKFHGPHVASVGRAAFEAVADEPVFQHHQGPPAATQITFRDVLEPVPPTDRRRRVKFGGGLVDRVAAALRTKGFAISISRPTAWPWTDAKVSDQSGEWLVRTQGRLQSLGVVPSLSERLRIVAQLGQINPAANVIVIGKNNKDAMEFAEPLTSATKREVTWFPAIPNSHPWLHVVSVGGLATCWTPNWNFVVFLDAELALSKTAAEYLALCSGAARFGFLQRDMRMLNPIEQATLEAVFGPMIYGAAVDTPRTRVAVGWLPTTKVAVPGGSTLERQRNQVWANAARNSSIAHAARCLSDNDMAALKVIDLDRQADWLGMPANRPTVAIIAANLEQGEHLARLMPDWRLEWDGYKPPVGQVDQHDRVIMTLARAAANLVATSVVVYAAGGMDRWTDHLRLVTSAWAVPKRLIIDVADQHDTRSITATRIRAGHYDRTASTGSVTGKATGEQETYEKGGRPLEES